MSKFGTMTPDQKAQAIDMAEEGATLRAIAKRLGIDVRRITKARKGDLTFDNEMTRARDLGIEIQADDLLEVDSEENAGKDVQLIKLKSDNVKWLIARRAPKRYGDRLEVNLNQTLDLSGALIEARKRAPLLPASNLIRLSNVQDTEYTELIDVRPTDKTPVRPDSDGEQDIFA